MKYSLLICLGISILSIWSCQTAYDKQPSQILPIEQLDFTQNYHLYDTIYGTNTSVEIKGEHRIMQSNGLPNHRTGTFPNQGNPNQITKQNVKYSIPLKPQLSGKSQWAREPGVAVNGVKFEPETAERFICETGEVYRIEAFQNLVDLGLDHNHAHVQPTGAYHYHGVPTELVKILDKGEDIILVGYALDGFPIYYSKSGRYKPSYILSKDLRKGDICEYKNPTEWMEKNLSNTAPDGTFVSDWTYTKGTGQLDECNGIEINGQYGYFITKEYPYVGRCLKGKFDTGEFFGTTAAPPGSHSHHHNH